MIKSTVAHAISMTGLIWVLAGPATAASPPAPDSPEHLGDNIRSQFSERYSNGTVGLDWCFNVETERGYSWWYYKTGTDMAAAQVGRTARIQAIYDRQNDMGTVIGRAYASVFLGIKTDGAGSIFKANEFDLNFTSSTAKVPPVPKDRSKEVTSTKSPITSSDGYLVIPDESSGSQCLSFGSFLQAYVLPHTLKPTTAVVKRDNDSFGSDYKKAIRYWMFNGRGHQVFNVATYDITITPETGGSDVVVTLVVGFGGGAGP